MRSLKLTATREDLLRALNVLGVARRARFKSTVPVWLHFDEERQELRLVEERGKVTAALAAAGYWPPAGLTVDLFMLKRAVAAYTGEAVDLHTAADSLLVFGNQWRVRLKLLRFGPESGRPAGPRDPLASLPLFEWGDRRR
jgi:hypothetical protein